MGRAGCKHSEKVTLLTFVCKMACNICSDFVTWHIALLVQTLN